MCQNENQRESRLKARSSSAKCLTGVRLLVLWPHPINCQSQGASYDQSEWCKVYRSMFWAPGSVGSLNRIQTSINYLLLDPEIIIIQLPECYIHNSLSSKSFKCTFIWMLMLLIGQEAVGLASDWLIDMPEAPKDDIELHTYSWETI